MRVTAFTEPKWHMKKFVGKGYNIINICVEGNLLDVVQGFLVE